MIIIFYSRLQRRLTSKNELTLQSQSSVKLLLRSWAWKYKIVLGVAIKRDMICIECKHTHTHTEVLRTLKYRICLRTLKYCWMNAWLVQYKSQLRVLLKLNWNLNRWLYVLFSYLTVCVCMCVCLLGLNKIINYYEQQVIFAHRK